MTTTGGQIISGSPTFYDEKGRPFALKGDLATCGNCKGAFPIYGTADSYIENGKPMVRHRDRVMCPCGKNCVLASSDSTVYFMDGGSAGASSATAAASPQPSLLTVGTFDEQLRAAALGVALDGYPYFIETADGRTHAGRIDANGQLPRIYTDASDDYIVHWGDGALAKQEGA